MKQEDIIAPVTANVNVKGQGQKQSLNICVSDLKNYILTDFKNATLR